MKMIWLSKELDRINDKELNDKIKKYQYMQGYHLKIKSELLDAWQRQGILWQ